MLRESLHLVGHYLERFRPRQPLPVWYSPYYRLPISSLEGQRGLEPRRADYVLWYLGDTGVVEPGEVRLPDRVSYEQMALVHQRAYLESLTHAPTLARIFATDISEIRVDEILLTMRLATGATIAATREALRRRGPTLNLLGGFHHAAPDRGGGLCTINDIAIAIAVLRREGYVGRVCVLDLDAHPPDGTAACLARDELSWIGSISGSDWGPLNQVDEVLLPRRAGDGAYLGALEGLLSRMPQPDLAFVICGGDVLDGDPLGALGLSLAGARQRDLRVVQALTGIPAVWLPGGGYHPDSWKVLAGAALAISRRSRRPVRPRYDPLTSRFALIAAELQPQLLHGDDREHDEDLEVALGFRRGRPRLLDFYTAEGVEYALFQYGIFDFLRRVGYDRFRVELKPASCGGDQVRIFGVAPADRDHGEYLLIDGALERQRLDGADVLYLHWLSLRNPRAKFSERRPRLPGQDVPGLGIAREIIELLGRISERLHLAGVAYRPAFYHTAWPARHRFQFFDAARQGRFEALARDLAHLPLLEASLAVSEGRVKMNDQPYTWESDLMVFWIAGEPAADPARSAVVAAERERARFTVEPRTGGPTDRSTGNSDTGPSRTQRRT